MKYETTDYKNHTMTISAFKMYQFIKVYTFYI